MAYEASFSKASGQSAGRSQKVEPAKPLPYAFEDAGVSQYERPGSRPKTAADREAIARCVALDLF